MFIDAKIYEEILPLVSEHTGPPPGEPTNNNKAISLLANSITALLNHQLQQHPPQISRSFVKVTGVLSFEFTTVEAQPEDTIGKIIMRVYETKNFDGQNAFIGKIWDEERETRYVTCANDNDAVIRMTIENCKNIVWKPGFFNSIVLSIEEKPLVEADYEDREAFMEMLR